MWSSALRPLKRWFLKKFQRVKEKHFTGTQETVIIILVEKQLEENKHGC